MRQKTRSACNSCRGARLSPDGRFAVYVVSRTDAAANDGAGADYADLWLCRLEDEHTFALTSGDHSDYAPRWSPDGRQISFLSTRAGAPQIFLIAPDGGEARQLTSLHQGVAGAGEWSPDSQQLAFNAGPKPDDLPAPGAPFRVSRNIFRFDGLGMVDHAVQNLFVIAADGGEPRQLTDDGHLNTQARWSPAGDALLYSAAFPPHEDRFMPGLRIVNLEGETRDLIWDGWLATQAAWLPDGQRVAFIGQEIDLIPGSLSQLYTIALADGRMEQRSELAGAVGGGLQGDMPALAPARRPAAGRAGWRERLHPGAGWRPVARVSLRVERRYRLPAAHRRRRSFRPAHRRRMSASCSISPPATRTPRN